MSKIILWDWDNTLADTFGAILVAQNVMRQAYNLSPWTKEEAKIAMNSSGRNLIKNLVGEENASEIVLKEGAKEIVHITKEHGYINILASNKAGPILRNEVETLSLTKFFDKIIGAEDFEHDKPSKEFTDSAINGYTIDELYSVGDGKADIKMAHNYPNGKGILVWTDPNTPEFNEIKPDIVCSSLVDLKAILTNQKQRS